MVSFKQISEVVSSMKDMIDFCRDQKVGPIGKFFIHQYAFYVSLSLWLCEACVHVQRR